MIHVRPANLADVPAIVAIHCADLVTWKRWGADGEASLADYAELSPYERWLNGGPWMDPTTYAPFLERLLRLEGAAVALVAELDGEVRAMAEGWLGDELAPYGRNLNVSVIYTLRGFAGRGLGTALMQALEDLAAAAGCETLMVSHAEAPQFYARRGFVQGETWRRARLAPRAGNSQYTAEPQPLGDYSLAKGWAMPVGRYQSARQEWERAQPRAEPAFEAWHDLRRRMWRLEVRKTPAVLMLEEAARDPGAASVHLWTPEAGLSRQLLQAIRDLGAQAGFRELLFFVPETGLAQLGHDWRDDGYKQQVWMKRLPQHAGV